MAKPSWNQFEKIQKDLVSNQVKEEGSIRILALNKERRLETGEGM